MAKGVKTNAGSKKKNSAIGEDAAMIAEESKTAVNKAALVYRDASDDDDDQDHDSSQAIDKNNNNISDGDDLDMISSQEDEGDSDEEEIKQIPLKKLADKSLRKRAKQAA